MQKIHLDTDFGGDIDDLCALAMLLRWSKDLQITGLTTVAESNGKRAGSEMNIEQDRGIYIVPNVWLVHQIG